MKSQRIDIASIRRVQIVEAAVAVITEQGLQNLSLSKIENRAGMSRGQLMHYFPAKEDILLAVFDRLVLLMHERIGHPDGQPCAALSAWSMVEHLLDKLLTEPLLNPEFGCLQYTFLSQIGHREDFRQRLATLYETWRSSMALGLAGDLVREPSRHSLSPRAFATLVQAILHGLAIQRAADPDAFQGEEMLKLCLDVLGSYLWDRPRVRGKKRPARLKPPSRALLARQGKSSSPATTKEVNGVRSRRS